jgi:hypothetical protein
MKDISGAYHICIDGERGATQVLLPPYALNHIMGEKGNVWLVNKKTIQRKKRAQ